MAWTAQDEMGQGLKLLQKLADDVAERMGADTRYMVVGRLTSDGKPQFRVWDKNLRFYLISNWRSYRTVHELLWFAKAAARWRHQAGSDE